MTRKNDMKNDTKKWHEKMIRKIDSKKWLEKIPGKIDKKNWDEKMTRKIDTKKLTRNDDMKWWHEKNDKKNWYESQKMLSTKPQLMETRCLTFKRFWCKQPYLSIYVMAPFWRNLSQKHHHVGENPHFWLHSVFLWKSKQ